MNEENQNKVKNEHLLGKFQELKYNIKKNANWIQFFFKITPEEYHIEDAIKPNEEKKDSMNKLP